MGKFIGLINKLILALETKGRIILLSRQQCWNSEHCRRSTLILVAESAPVEEYNRRHPDKKKPLSLERVKETIYSSFSEQDVLQYLVAEWEKVKDDGGG